MKEIQDEITLFLAMMPSVFNERKEREKLKFAMAKIDHSELHVSLKAVAVYNHMALDREKRQFMLESNMIDHLLVLMNHKI